MAIEGRGDDLERAVAVEVTEGRRRREAGLRAVELVLGGRVVDWITVHWWPTFNVADSGVVVGGIALAIVMLAVLPALVAALTEVPYASA